MGRNAHERYRARLTLTVDVDLTAPDIDEAHERVGDVVAVLERRLSGRLTADRRHLLGMPVLTYRGAETITETV